MTSVVVRNAPSNGHIHADNDSDDDEKSHVITADSLSLIAAPHIRDEINPEARVVLSAGDSADPFDSRRASRVSDRDNSYRARRFDRALSPSRDAGRNSDVAEREKEILREEALVIKQIQQAAIMRAAKAAAAAAARSTKRIRSSEGASSWDGEEPLMSASEEAEEHEERSRAAKTEWDDTPQRLLDDTPSSSPPRKRNRWGEQSTEDGATDVPERKQHIRPPVPLFDQTDAAADMTPSRKANRWSKTPAPPPIASTASAAPLSVDLYRQQMEMDRRNAPLSDADLEALLPGTVDGFQIVTPPQSYKRKDTSASDQATFAAATTPLAHHSGFFMAETALSNSLLADIPMTSDESGLPAFTKADDAAFFGVLFDNVADDDITDPTERTRRRILRLILKIKNGLPPQRKSALRQLTDRAREFGCAALFDTILPMLMSPQLEDQERHLLTKCIDRVLFKVTDLDQRYVHKILVVIEPLLIDEDYYARVEGRQIISNLSKAAGLATMIEVLLPDIDSHDEYVRNTTARAFAVVASACGIHALIPFLRSICHLRTWEGRHTGMKIIQQIAILLGPAVLPHLTQLVECMQLGLDDEQVKVKCITALSLAALAESAFPYGIESFDPILKPLWRGIHQHRGKTLAAFLKAIGYIIPLMDTAYAAHFTQVVMPVVTREFANPDEEMKKILLKVIKQCVGCDGVDTAYVRASIMPDFFKCFWVRRMALERRNARELIDTTVELSHKVGTSDIISRIVHELKDESELYRILIVETIDKVVTAEGATDIGQSLEERLIDGLLYAYQEQTAMTEDSPVMLNGFGVVISALGKRTKAYLPQICGIIKWRLNNKLAKVRQQSADLITRIAAVMSVCDEEKLLAHLGVVCYEYLGEEFPDVLASILAALLAIVDALGMSKMTPPISEILPRLTPILRNRHEAVQEACIKLVGRIADGGADVISGKEWMRICHELIDMLKAHKKSIRRAAVSTFGSIAKAIGPHDVVATLLNNLRVQERQNRVATTVALAIVAEQCAPFTVVPALMNEYRVRELNVQNGVLKAFSFMFEYIVEMGKDYIHTLIPLLEDALTDRDTVHRQTAATMVKHMALGTVGLGYNDCFIHLLNFIWPNIFEQSPHVINSIMDAIEAIRVALGPNIILTYLLTGLYHPSRAVRTVYWRIYNQTYVAGAHAMVSAYPQLPNDANNDYTRYELMTFI